MRCKVRHFTSRRDSISPSFVCTTREITITYLERKRVVSAAARLSLYNSSLSPSSELLYGHPTLVAPLVSGQTSACIPTLVPFWILQVHPSGIPALALRASVQWLLSSFILLVNTTGPMLDSSSSCLDTFF
ncbi:hypothetical protein Acr_10g0008810 [Actinidia rufa]|uniref:Uncharacterized protein n=1 Tax=Actinidia rufa TaxID=165716 RepID=A0A7J0FAP8_9ERIC|nr:hypothetical protein Acr_10g0008810 [Actinidia rufa]